eukprot:m.306869 g.306869  ORF g.306869 m.306869 type:complete len:1382 (+) comp15926_c0_seq1:244-4389(+)
MAASFSNAIPPLSTVAERDADGENERVKTRLQMFPRDSSIVDLNHTEIGDEQTGNVLQSLRDNGYHPVHLILTFNHIGDVGAKYLAKELRFNSILTTLALSSNKIGNAGMEYIANSLYSNMTLTALDLSSNDIGGAGAKHLAFALAGKLFGLQRLILSDNPIDDIGAKMLGKALRTNKSLVHLDLSGTGIGDEGTCQLADGLKPNRFLSELVLRRNSIGQIGIAALTEALRVNRTVTVLHCSYDRDSFRGSGANSLLESLRQNRRRDKRAAETVSGNSVTLIGVSDGCSQQVLSGLLTQCARAAPGPRSRGIRQFIAMHAANDSPDSDAVGDLELTKQAEKGHDHAGRIRQLLETPSAILPPVYQYRDYGITTKKNLGSMFLRSTNTTCIVASFEDLVQDIAGNTSSVDSVQMHTNVVDGIITWLDSIRAYTMCGDILVVLTHSNPIDQKDQQSVALHLMNYFKRDANCLERLIRSPGDWPFFLVNTCDDADNQGLSTLWHTLCYIGQQPPTLPVDIPVWGEVIMEMHTALCQPTQLPMPDFSPYCEKDAQTFLHALQANGLRAVHKHLASQLSALARNWISFAPRETILSYERSQFAELARCIQADLTDCEIEQMLILLAHQRVLFSSAVPSQRQVIVLDPLWRLDAFVLLTMKSEADVHRHFGDRSVEWWDTYGKDLIAHCNTFAKTGVIDSAALPILLPANQSDLQQYILQVLEEHSLIAPCAAQSESTRKYFVFTHMPDRQRLSDANPELCGGDGMPSQLIGREGWVQKHGCFAIVHQSNSPVTSMALLKASSCVPKPFFTLLIAKVYQAAFQVMESGQEVPTTSKLVQSSQCWEPIVCGDYLMVEVAPGVYLELSWNSYCVAFTIHEPPTLANEHIETTVIEMVLHLLQSIVPSTMQPLALSAVDGSAAAVWQSTHRLYQATASLAALEKEFDGTNGGAGSIDDEGGKTTGAGRSQVDGSVEDFLVDDDRDDDYVVGDVGETEDVEESAHPPADNLTSSTLQVVKMPSSFSILNWWSKMVEGKLQSKLITWIVGHIQTISSSTCGEGISLSGTPEISSSDDPNRSHAVQLFLQHAFQLHLHNDSTKVFGKQPWCINKQAHEEQQEQECLHPRGIHHSLQNLVVQSSSSSVDGGQYPTQHTATTLRALPSSDEGSAVDQPLEELCYVLEDAEMSEARRRRARDLMACAEEYGIEAGEACVLLLWHGPRSEAAADVMLHTGQCCCCHEQRQFGGSCINLSVQPESALGYATGTRYDSRQKPFEGELCLVLCAVLVGPVLPTTLEDYSISSHKQGARDVVLGSLTKSARQIKAQTGCMAEYVQTRKGRPTTSTETEFDCEEFVVDNPAAILPMAKVKVTLSTQGSLQLHGMFPPDLLLM